MQIVWIVLRLRDAIRLLFQHAVKLIRKVNPDNATRKLQAGSILKYLLMGENRNDISNTKLTGSLYVSKKPVIPQGDFETAILCQ